MLHILFVPWTRLHVAGTSVVDVHPDVMSGSYTTNPACVVWSD